jgi:CBS domain-containing protein
MAPRAVGTHHALVGKNPRSEVVVMQVRDLMAVDVIVIPIAATVTEAAEILRSGRVSGAPVVDRAGNPVGVVSVSDVAFGWGKQEAERQRVFYRTAGGQFLPIAEDEPSHFGERPVADVMMPLVISVQQEDSVRHAAALMTVEEIHRVIVLDGERLVGILSVSDIAAAVGRGDLVDPKSD